MYVLNPNKCVLLFLHLNNEVEVTRISILHATYIGLNIMWNTKLLFRKKLFSISYCIVSAHRICGKSRSINTHIYSYKITKNRWTPCLIFFLLSLLWIRILSQPKNIYTSKFTCNKQKKGLSYQSMKTLVFKALYLIQNDTEVNINNINCYPELFVFVKWFVFVLVWLVARVLKSE